ncbi:MAG: hypothetical protein ACRC31_00455 [Cetobacterium sp.]
MKRIKGISIIPSVSEECKVTMMNFWIQYHKWAEDKMRPSVPKFLNYLLEVHRSVNKKDK